MTDNEQRCLSVLREAGGVVVSRTVQQVADAAGLSWDDASKGLIGLADNHGMQIRFGGVAGDPDDDSEGDVVYLFFLQGVSK